MEKTGGKKCNSLLEITNKELPCIASLVDGLATIVQFAGMLTRTLILMDTGHVVIEDGSFGTRARLNTAITRVVVVLVVASLWTGGCVFRENLVAQAADILTAKIFASVHTILADTSIKQIQKKNNVNYLILNN